MSACFAPGVKRSASLMCRFHLRSDLREADEKVKKDHCQLLLHGVVALRSLFHALFLPHASKTVRKECKFHSSGTSEKAILMCKMYWHTSCDNAGTTAQVNKVGKKIKMSRKRREGGGKTDFYFYNFIPVGPLAYFERQSEWLEGFSEIGK